MKTTMNINLAIACGIGGFFQPFLIALAIAFVILEIVDKHFAQELAKLESDTAKQTNLRLNALEEQSSRSASDIKGLFNKAGIATMTGTRPRG